MKTIRKNHPRSYVMPIVIFISNKRSTMNTITLTPKKEGVDGFEAYLKQYRAGLAAERALSELTD